MQEGEEQGTTTEKRARSSGEAYERFVAQAKAAVAAAAEAVVGKAEAAVEKAEAAVEQRPAAAGFRQGVIRLLGRNEPQAQSPPAEAEVGRAAAPAASGTGEQGEVADVVRQPVQDDRSVPADEPEAAAAPEPEAAPPEPEPPAPAAGRLRSGGATYGGARGATPDAPVQPAAAVEAAAAEPATEAPLESEPAPQPAAEPAPAPSAPSGEIARLEQEAKDAAAAAYEAYNVPHGHLPAPNAGELLAAAAEAARKLAAAKGG